MQVTSKVAAYLLPEAHGICQQLDVFFLSFPGMFEPGSWLIRYLAFPWWIYGQDFDGFCMLHITEVLVIPSAPSVTWGRSLGTSGHHKGGRVRSQRMVAILVYCHHTKTD